VQADFFCPARPASLFNPRLAHRIQEFLEFDIAISRPTVEVALFAQRMLRVRGIVPKDLALVAGCYIEASLRLTNVNLAVDARLATINQDLKSTGRTPYE
jgi:hypothetical protein